MSVSSKPILIVNADDYGWNSEATDKTLDAFAATRITSATALVYMEDSDRAAELALEAKLPVGLHLNLTDPFTDPSANATQRARQLLVCKLFAAWRFRLRSWTFDPRIRKQVEGAISDQLERFHELYGQPPTHLDGHNHVHVCPNVALAASLASIEKMRDGLSTWPSIRTAMGAARALRRALVSRRFLRTRYFLDIALLHRDFDPQERTERVGRAGRASLEVMAHPGFPHEQRSLMSRDWGQLVEALPLGSYRDLA
jgi:chitin disaccharide deacetylase